MIIVISGTPGTGKTKLAKALAKVIDHRYMDVNIIIKENKLSKGFDKEKDCEIVDTEKLNTVLNDLADRGDLVIDSHLSHYLSEDLVDWCIITKCELKELEKRLKKREYSKAKVRENLDAEIFDTCLVEAEEEGHKIIVVDTTKDYNLKELVGKLKND